jgi:hypothetical protein
MIITTPSCLFCGNTAEIEVEPSAYERWRKGQYAQDAFPNFTPDQRELLITGTHAHCWEANMKDE